MNRPFELAAFGRVDLDGTHRAVIESSHPDFASSPGTDGTVYLKLTFNGRSCGCLLAKVVAGEENRVYLDRFKQWHLNVEDGQPIAVEQFTPRPCTRLALRVPSDFSERDAIRFIGKPISQNERTALFSFSGQTRPMVVTAVSPEEIVLVSSETEITTTALQAQGAPTTYRDIGGLRREVTLIREVIEYPIRYPDVFKHLGVTPPKGIILHGPPGTGKTLIAKALANEVGAQFYAISGPEIYSKWYGKSEETLRNLFEEAVKHAPSIVVIDELDALVPRRETTHGDQEQRIVATFLAQMDGLKELKDVVVVGTTNRIDAIDPALRRGGRFEYEVNISVPDAAGRKQILEIHTRQMPLSDEVELERIAEETTGYVGADLASLCRESAYNALRRAIAARAADGQALDLGEQITIGQSDFDAAVATVPPSAAKEFAFEIPKITWDDVGGMSQIKQLLTENISFAIKRQQAFVKAGVKPASGVLLHGPSGTGKTLLAQAVAHECNASFIAIKGPQLRSKWTGTAEEKIRTIFKKARTLSPCVIFFDEIDATVPLRGRDITGYTDSITNQILSEMDGIESGKGLFVLGATNKLRALDPALLRPGRFDHVIEVPLPDLASRRAILAVHTKRKTLHPEVDLNQWAGDTEGLSGADIAEICRGAAWMALREAGFDADEVVLTTAHFQASSKSVTERLAYVRQAEASVDGSNER